MLIYVLIFCLVSKIIKLVDELLKIYKNIVINCYYFIGWCIIFYEILYLV